MQNSGGFDDVPVGEVEREREKASQAHVTSSYLATSLEQSVLLRLQACSGSSSLQDAVVLREKVNRNI